MASTNERPHLWLYEEKKESKTFMLTNAASKLITQKAVELRLTRSEVIERAIRNGGLSLVANCEEEENSGMITE